MVDKLCSRILHWKDQRRDVASVALETIIAEAGNMSVVQCVIVTRSPQLEKGITSPGMSTEIKYSMLTT